MCGQLNLVCFDKVEHLSLQSVFLRVKETWVCVLHMHGLSAPSDWDPDGGRPGPLGCSQSVVWEVRESHFPPAADKKS